MQRRAFNHAGRCSDRARIAALLEGATTGTNRTHWLSVAVQYENDGPVRQLWLSCDDWLHLAIRIMVLRVTSIVF
jgi:hypothetical protein